MQRSDSAGLDARSMSRVIAMNWAAREKEVCQGGVSPKKARNSGWPYSDSGPTLWHMIATQLISAHVSQGMKARFRSLAEQQEMTQAALLKQLIDSAVRCAGDTETHALKSPVRRVGGTRTYALLHPDDKRLLTERAASRHMGAATYISVLVRAHLRNLAPLPKAELMALKQSVAELGAIARPLNQMIRSADQRAGMARPTREDLLATLKVCEALRNHTKELLKANAHSWRTGYESVPS